MPHFATFGIWMSGSRHIMPIEHSAAPGSAAESEAAERRMCKRARVRQASICEAAANVVMRWICEVLGVG